MESNQFIAVIGLGYVGLPLAVEFAKKYAVVGFDINKLRTEELTKGHDHTMEIKEGDLKKVLCSKPGSKGLYCSDKISDIGSCTFYIVTVPTPTDKHNHPDLTLLYKASEMVGSVLKKGDVVIYESTVYPGATEEECAPLLEKTSRLIFNKDFFCGYSPERINTGDKLHTVAKILKITSGSTPEIAKKVDDLYLSIIEAGTHSAPSIKVAEAAKVIENSQRDINIAFVNELAKIFNLLGIDTNAVLQAAGTKWNFLKFKPGLVGGHCIGVAPYYLAQKAQLAGYHPEIILAGRRLNDSMGAYVASETIKLMIKKEIPVKNASILILGFTFKENCNDVRNTRVIDIVNELKSYHAKISICDPWAEPDIVEHEYGIQTIKSLSGNSEKYDAVILAVAHEEFNKLDIPSLVNKRSVVYDVKGVLNSDMIDARL
ncbi:MAG TPA: nucleotide sugar dehydrogenase [Puia sp.]|jgi:UDP-N-acetyl-D-galactosamine dehydrogenase|nr:nucleotide sugar dehydrogenase [Puia sp.]